MLLEVPTGAKWSYTRRGPWCLIVNESSDRSIDALRRLLRDAVDGGQAKVDALIALAQRSVFVAAWPEVEQGYRTLVSSDGVVALPIFTDIDQLYAAANRFGWREPSGVVRHEEIEARHAFQYIITQDLSYVVVDIASDCCLEVEQSELEPLLSPRALRDSQGPFAGVGKLTDSMRARVRPTPPPPRANSSSSAPKMTEQSPSGHPAVRTSPGTYGAAANERIHTVPEQLTRTSERVVHEGSPSRSNSTGSNRPSDDSLWIPATSEAPKVTRPKLRLSESPGEFESRRPKTPGSAGQISASHRSSLSDGEPSAPAVIQHELNEQKSQKNPDLTAETLPTLEDPAAQVSLESSPRKTIPHGVRASSHRPPAAHPELPLPSIDADISSVTVQSDLPTIGQAAEDPDAAPESPKTPEPSSAHGKTQSVPSTPAENTIQFEALPELPAEGVLKALADPLKEYLEVDWALLCQARIEGDEAKATIGIRIDASFRSRVGSIIEVLRITGQEHGMNLQVLLLDDPATIRTARVAALPFYPWRRRQDR